MEEFADVVDSDTNDCLKSRLDVFWTNQDIQLGSRIDWDRELKSMFVTTFFFKILLKLTEMKIRI